MGDKVRVATSLFSEDEEEIAEALAELPSEQDSKRLRIMDTLSEESRALFGCHEHVDGWCQD
jgi:DNA-binding transcriptional ArsR family regulator